jgi:HEAT repeat protein
MDEIDFFIDQLASDEFSTRRQAAEMLGEFGAAKAVKPLLKLLGDNHWQVRNTVIASLILIREKATIQPLVDCLKEKDVTIRNSAMSALQEMGEDVVPPLRELLHEKPSVDAKIFAANTLGNLGIPDAVNELIEFLGDPDGNVRFASAEALGQIGSPIAVGPILKTLANEDEWAKFPYIDALGHIGDELACPAIIQMLDDDILRISAISSLGDIGSLSGFLPILEIMKTSDDKNTLMACIASIVRIKESERDMAKVTRHGFYYYKMIKALKAVNTPHITGAISEMTESSDIETIKTAASFLWDFHGKFPVAKLFPLLMNDLIEDEINDLIIVQGSTALSEIVEGLKSPQKTVQVSLIKCIGLLGTKNEEEVLKPFLDSPDRDIVSETIKSLGLIGATGLFERFVEFLKSDDDLIRKSSVASLSLIFKANQDKVKDIVESNDEMVRLGLYQTLGYHTLEDIPALLFSGFSDPNSETRAAAIHSFGYLKPDKRREIMDDEDFLPTISRLLLDESNRVIIETIWTLSAIEHPNAGELLLGMLETDDPDVMRYAISAAGRNKNSKAGDLLTRMLESESDPETKVILCIALRNCGNENAVPILIRLIGDAAPEIVSEAITALATIGGEEAKEKIVPCLQNESWIVKVSALKCIASLNAETAIGEVRDIIENGDDNGHGRILIRTAIQTVGKIGGPNEVDLLLEHLGNTAYRFEAFNALTDIFKKHDIKLDLSSINNRQIRQYACILLGYFENCQNHKTLLECLKDRYPSVQRAAALALSTYDSTSVRHFGSEISGTDDPWIKKLLSNKQ